LRGTVGDIEAAPGGAGLALEVLGECVAVATQSGYPPGEAYLTRTRASVTAKGSGSAPSMYRDLSQGLPVEADQIVGDMLARARGFGIAAPILTAAYASLSIYSARIGAG
jgi:2-dehydropantoate 2-reductase